MLINEGARRSEQISELARELKLARHLDHRAAESELREELLCAGVLLRRPQHDAWHAALAQPRDRLLEERGCRSAASASLVHHDVVDVAAFIAQLFPRNWLDGGVDVAKHLAVLLGNIDHHVLVFELPAEKPRVALGRIR